MMQMRTGSLGLLLVATSLLPATAQPLSPSPNRSASSSPSAPAMPSATPASPAAGPTTLTDFARARLDTILRGGKANPDWFSQSFLAKIPVTRVEALVAHIKSSIGEYRSIDGKQGDYVALFASGVDEVLVHFDAGNKIDLLFFKPPVARRR